LPQGLPGQGYGDTLVAAMYQPRTYRQWTTTEDLVTFRVVVRETDLLVRAKSDLSSQALEIVKRCRAGLEDYIRKHPLFALTLEPISVEDDAPAIVRNMALAGEAVGVGPMAAVAGAIARELGMWLLEFSDEVVVENGGDIFIRSLRPRLVGLYAGESPLTGKVVFMIRPEDTPLGICTSSGTVGHSLSFGLSDAATVFSPCAALADAAATAIGNRVRLAEDIPRAIEFAQRVPGLSGVAIVKDNVLGLWGKVQLASVH
jgi:ApbE superfamily uncharacterized protein (UPF0280 family)